MIYLFVDNFRGFTNTFIPIEDVNFLVGENSTGKTSILGLLNLLSDARFWLHQDFDINEVGFTHFNDIVSVGSSERSYFSVGLIETKKEVGKKNIDVNAFLMTFIEEDGRPRLASFVYNIEQTEFRMKFARKRIKYKHTLLDNFDNDKDFINKIYSDWIEVYRSDKKGYKFLEIEIPDERLPPLIISSILEDTVIHKKPKLAGRLTFRFTIFGRVGIAWMAPIRTKPKRTYDAYKVDFSPEGDHTPYIIRKILDQTSESKEFSNFISRIGKESGLFEKVTVKKYGKLPTAPFELQIILGKKELSVCCVGYGVSQSLPVIVELFMRSSGQWFAIQQPEVHLHPKAQAALGDLFFKSAVSDNKKFLIETHSDYTIDRFRMNYRKKNKKVLPKSQIIFFERDRDVNKAYRIQIEEKGELPVDQPAGYRKFFIKEEMKILDL